MRLSELTEGVKILSDYKDCEIRAVTSDSKRVCEGDLFICHVGVHHDGHYHAEEALRRGAAYVLAEHPTDTVPAEKTLLTDNTRKSESFIWNNLTYRPAEKLKVVAVTGTAGKTTVAHLICHILSCAGKRAGLISTVGAFAAGEKIALGDNGGSSLSGTQGAMTTPDPEFFFPAARKMLEMGSDTLVFEASSHALDSGKISAIRPDIAVFTNLSPEHMDRHGTMEEYFRAKAKLAEMSDKCIVNADDPMLSCLPTVYPDKEFVLCSADVAKVSESDVTALRYIPFGSSRDGGIEYVYFSSDAVFKIRAPLMGRYSVYNTMEAAASAIELGIPPIKVKEALLTFSGVEGRLMRVIIPEAETAEEIADFFIDYAHTSASLEAVLSSLREGGTWGRIAVLFGCGGERDRTKRAEMAKTAEKYADFIIVTGDNPRNEDPDGIIADILVGLTGEKPYTVIKKREEAIRYAVMTFSCGDTVLLAGKGHEKYEITKDGKKPFDEYELVRYYAKEKLEKIND